MGLNSYHYDGLQLKINAGMIKLHEFNLPSQNTQGTIHLRRRHSLEGGGSKIVKICRRLKWNKIGSGVV